jgi:hypothetical protein
MRVRRAAPLSAPLRTVAVDDERAFADDREDDLLKPVPRVDVTVDQPRPDRFRVAGDDDVCVPPAGRP